MKVFPGLLLQPEAPSFSPKQPSTQNPRAERPGEMNNNQPRPVTEAFTQERTHKTSKTDHVSLMVLLGFISDGRKKLRVNVT